MAAFEYTALNAKGKTVKGVIEGDHPRHIRQKLREQSLSPLQITEAAPSKKLHSDAGGRSSFFSARRSIKLSPVDLTLMSRQLATLVKSGMPIERALHSVSQQTDKQKIATLLVSLRAKVLEGHSLADAFAEYPDVFPEIYRSTIAAGEVSGNLDTVLMRLADYAERKHEASKKMLESLMYPVIVLVMSLLILGVLMTYVVPKVVGIFESNSAELPALTQFIFSASAFVIGYWWLIAGVVFGLMFLWSVLMMNKGNRTRFHGFLLKLPFIGSVIRARNAATFSRTLGILVGSGVSALSAIRIATDVVSNLPMRKAVEQAGVKVKEGSAIAKSLGDTKQFPGMMIHLINSGEESGNLDEMLISAADYQDMEVQAKTSAAMAAIQPLMIVGLGAMVLTIMTGILLPISNMSALLQNG